jgi:hypothetical protein
MNTATRFQQSKGRRQDGVREREKKLREAYALNFRVDYDWLTKKRNIPAVMGCTDGTFVNGQCYDDSVGPPIVRVPADLGKYVYSQSTTPPVGPTELMARVEKAGVPILARFFCRVENVTTETMTALAPSKVADEYTLTRQEFVVIDCESLRGLDSIIRISGAPTKIAAGDVVSAPVAGVKRPEGVLLKTMGERELRWTIDADAASVVVDRPAQCPTTTEILAAAKNK